MVVLLFFKCIISMWFLKELSCSSWLLVCRLVVLRVFSMNFGVRLLKLRLGVVCIW